MGCRLRAAPFFRYPGGEGGGGVHPETMNETTPIYQRAPWMIARAAGHLIANEAGNLIAIAA